MLTQGSIDGSDYVSRLIYEQDDNHFFFFFPHVVVFTSHYMLRDERPLLLLQGELAAIIRLIDRRMNQETKVKVKVSKPALFLL